MILKRGVILQLIAFAVITVVGVTIVAVNYIGIGRGLLGREYTAYVDLTDSGGVFTNAEVTYRGVPVGRVGPIELTRDGIRVKLVLERGERIPRDGTKAIVANRSAVGEQYIDLEPTKKSGPYLDEGATYTIPRNRTTLPVPTAELLRNVDALVGSVNTKHLGVIVDELGKAFTGSADDLQSLLDDTDRLLKTADQAYPDTKRLLDSGVTVLETQRGQAANIRGFARNLNDLTASLRDDDPALRKTIDGVPGAVSETHKAIDQLSPTLPILLANLTTTGQIVTSRKAGLRSLFVLYPMTVAGAFTVTPGDGTQHLGLALNIDEPPACTDGYEKVEHRWPQDTTSKNPPLNAGCKAPHDASTGVRGARNFPRDAIAPYPSVPPGATAGAGFPEDDDKTEAKASNPSPSAPTGQLSDGRLYLSYPAGSVEFAGYDPATGAVYGSDGARYVMPRSAGTRELGDSSWKWLMFGPLTQ
ncbi:phospholipid/cholesterol/gamma-HCH transport system substrate-binding protein [Actinomadura pelletieri DSM 43383]|uniref:Phospholipid/cholesterol/gamma-HCH transport system substrate-binding protein n=1 Tax=Actinomadura pelletieri DSM 43383 TaxID=1120940 RepID=A0A495QRR1_9ACTN|nr:MlaD family protein [Actinomadura pelletieri]RKS76071.1 phospholipid/cholesterol/gamma-HCH transport system substrate-binding protein [Actinomadura pelletieri DSM 43383]